MNDYFIIMENEPSIEDLRAEIIDYKKQIENQTTIIENLNNKITDFLIQLNSCQAKDKPPRPLRSERSRKADGTASSRIACQESTLWQC